MLNGCIIEKRLKQANKQTLKASVIRWGCDRVPSRRSPGEFYLFGCAGCTLSSRRSVVAQAVLSLLFTRLHKQHTHLRSLWRVTWIIHPFSLYVFAVKCVCGCMVSDHSPLPAVYLGQGRCTLLAVCGWAERCSEELVSPVHYCCCRFQLPVRRNTDTHQSTNAQTSTTH